MPLELLRTTNGTTNRYWYERDGLGNVVALTDRNGTVVDQYAYGLWGKPTIVSESVPQQLRYQGYWYDNELGWYWLTTGAYDPALERFLQPDPSEQDGLYSYAYVNDDPVDVNDPSGFAAAPMYCDSRCEGLIVLFNVWPTGMSAEQFVATGGSLDAPIQGGYDAGSHQGTTIRQRRAMGGVEVRPTRYRCHQPSATGKCRLLWWPLVRPRIGRLGLIPSPE